MLFLRNVNVTTHKKRIINFLKNNTFQRVLIGIATVLIAFLIIESGAAPKKYKLTLGQKSPYDITAPRDIENKIATARNRKDAAAAVVPDMKVIGTASIEVLSDADDFISMIESERDNIGKDLEEQGISKKDKNYKQELEKLQEKAAGILLNEAKDVSIPLSMDQARFLITKASDTDLDTFKKVTRDLIIQTMKDDITKENLADKIVRVQNDFQDQVMDQEFRNIGGLMIKAILKPNREIDEQATELKRQKAYSDKNNIEKIQKDSRIISFGEDVTLEKLQILEELNLLDTTNRLDVGFGIGIFAIILLLAVLLVIYMNNFCKQVLNSRSDLILLSVVITLALLIAWGVSGYSALAIPVFIAPMLISILLDMRLAMVVNIVLTILISFITKENLSFVYMSVISGMFSAFFVSKANQRSKLTVVGLIIGFINIIIIACFGLVSKSGFSSIIKDGVIVLVNGIISIIFTIGTLPFWETAFNIITPLKLLELANPNQPLVKRLLVEAPGTYHHSLMVGNLAEVATEAIGGNALLARVGAYFHDIGKLKRPNFFKENQMSDNPHDRMTANLSTLVITSHTHDGVELAEKYKVPLAIKDIIRQHHGTTLVAYFYHKARKGEKGESVNQENFRYEGPKPMTKEAAVVMLADSVEAAVRSMMDKTEGKIEGLVRKIIKDKLDDGQLDNCDLTLKDLDSIAKGFMRVFSGLFHEREEYPETRINMQDYDEIKIVDPMEEPLQQKLAE